MTTSAYTPSKPGDSAVLERLARQAQEGVSMDDARELVLRAYMAGFAAGVGEYISDRIPAEGADVQHGRASSTVRADGTTERINCFCWRSFAGTAPEGDFEHHLAITAVKR